jgi:hypothetical protein
MPVRFTPPEFVDLDQLDHPAVLQHVLTCFEEYLTYAFKNLSGEYMLLPTFGERPEQRERVYCYELYHQFRCAMTLAGQTQFMMNGEVDKRGHREMRRIMTNSDLIPDLLYHTPGDMRGNLVIVEVKTIRGDFDGFRKDLETLTGFTQEGLYRKGILLIFGYHHKANWKMRSLREQARHWHSDPNILINLEKIELFWHTGPGSEPQFLAWNLR